METRTKDRGLKISLSSLRISWKPMYSSDFKHGMAISLAIDAGCSLAGFQLRISAVPCQRYKIPDISPRWCVLGDSYDQQHLLLGSIASNQGEIWRDFDEPIFKYFKMFKIIQLKYIMTIFKFVESKIKIRFCAPWFLHVWAISWEFSSRFGRSQNDSWLTGPSTSSGENSTENSWTMWATWHNNMFNHYQQPSTR